MFLSHSYSVSKFPSITVITVIWDESIGETTVFSPAIFQAPFTTSYSDGIVGIVYRMSLPRGWCLCSLTAAPLVFMFSFTSAIARAIFYTLDYVVSVIKSTQKPLLLYTLWCVVHYMPSYNSFSVSIWNHPAYASRVVFICYLRWLRRYHSIFSSLWFR